MNEIKILLDVIYKTLSRGNKLIIPDEFSDEYKKFASERYIKSGNSSRATNKRVFIKKNLNRIYPTEFVKIQTKLYDRYYNDEYGLKLIARQLDCSYSSIRDIFLVFDIPIRTGNSVVTNRLCEFRKEKSKREYKARSGWFTSFDRKTHHTQQGVQGYYFNKSKNKNVWLRSTWEYIYAKWLDKNNIEWDVEVKVFQVNDKTYRPDFFIYETSTLQKIVEIKGYWKGNEWKTFELNDLLNIDVIIIDTINKYITMGSTYNKELREWKNKRILKNEL